ncbi:MAG TPA: cytochrome c peroxidase [Candidatus Polarisedimenticolaceae bacterium]|nr:cytochrome c peroxidase [Candidatus Polarisedimenticolaceae bacterium]
MLKPVPALLLVLAVSSRAAAQIPPRPPPLPPVPVPAENPISEAKRVLGKVLFWDEQLSSNGTVACGTCHRGRAGGSDGRIGIHPGPDMVAPSPDDIAGSPGVIRADASGTPIQDPVFGFGVQITDRAANSAVMAVYAPSLFWDGRATARFDDPETGFPSIAANGALESQAVGPIVSHVEMGRDGRTWTDVKAKLAVSHPLGDATDLPGDLAAALAGGAAYRDLFAAAFGDPAITGERIAYAIATYERTLIPNQTPWDRFRDGIPGAMTPGQVQGWNFFNGSPCRVCHVPPQFTDNGFHNLGLRPPAEDLGRQIVTGLAGDRGRFKTPTLRNAGLKPTHMHSGRILTMNDAVLWYRPNNPARFTDNLDPALPVGVPPDQLPALLDFLTNGLTDPRVAAETFPFDRPTLHAGALPRLDFASASTLQWPALAGVQRYGVYRGTLAGLRSGAGYGDCVASADPDVTDTQLVDGEVPDAGDGFFYLKSVVDGSGAERGLGTDSTGTPRSVLVGCPAP